MSSAIGATARAVTANWFSTVGGSAGSSSELPPIAINVASVRAPPAGAATAVVPGLAVLSGSFMELDSSAALSDVVPLGQYIRDGPDRQSGGSTPQLPG